MENETVNEARDNFFFDSTLKIILNEMPVKRLERKSLFHF